MPTTALTTSSPRVPESAFFRTFLLKVAARCNIDCTYCYEYRLADQSWRTKPALMSQDVLARATDRIVDHVVSHGVPSINIVFHGGEPLLAGPTFFHDAVVQLRDRVSAYCPVTFGVQSNGTLLDEAWLDLFRGLDVTIGVSADGPRHLNDRHRLGFRGESTYERVERSLRLLSDEKHRGVGSGVLCVIQPDSSPAELLSWVEQFGPIKVDFLFPHHHHASPPPYPHTDESGYGFGRWLTEVFDIWWNSDLSHLRIRIFEDIIHLLLGGYYTVESLGVSPARIVVIQTDGSYEALDSLKSTFDGAVSLKKNVFEHDLDTVLAEQLILSRIFRAEHLCDTCAACDLKNICGGGYVPHRYDAGNGFDMPSVYCQDLSFLIRHIAEAVGAHTALHGLPEGLSKVRQASSEPPL